MLPSSVRRASSAALFTVALAVMLVAAGMGHAAADSNEVNVYTYREAKLVAPLFEAFTKATGIKVNVISASAGLEQRIALKARTALQTCC